MVEEWCYNTNMGIRIYNSRTGWSKNKSLGGSYDGSKQMGDLAGMPLFASDPNEIVNQTYNLLVERSTTLFHTYYRS